MHESRIIVNCWELTKKLPFYPVLQGGNGTQLAGILNVMSLSVSQKADTLRCGSDSNKSTNQIQQFHKFIT